MNDNEDFNLETLRHVDKYEILHNDSGIIELEPPHGKFGIWCVKYNMNVSSGRSSKSALENLREHLKFGIKKIDEALKKGEMK